MHEFSTDVVKFSSTGKFSVDEFLVKHHKIVAKYIIDGDNEKIWGSMRSFLPNETLSFYDAVLALLKIKLIFNAPSKIKLSVKCPATSKDFETSIDIMAVYNEFYKFLEEYKPTTITDGAFTAKIHHPFFTKYPVGELEVVLSAVNELRVGDVIMDLRGVSHATRIEAFNSLPQKMGQKIFECLKEREQDMSNRVLHCIWSPHARDTKINFTISLHPAQFMELLKMCFSMDLSEHYRTCYQLSRDAHISFTEIDNITPSEKTALWKQHLEAIKQMQPSTSNNKIDVVPGANPF